ncbi:hypothetical protein [Streptosporangium vulgare]|uniref:hypothetical protein n=1 Tax=Streptosporangium vulgare TaxID=46190 RepID=UPI0031DB117F
MTEIPIFGLALRGADGCAPARAVRVTVASGPGRPVRAPAGPGAGFRVGLEAGAVVGVEVGAVVGLEVGAAVLVTVGAGPGVRVGPAHGEVSPLAPLVRPEGRPVTTTFQAAPHPTRGKANLTVRE